ncbi:extracellular solute-binding protein, partial [Paenibacillus sepulcri]|nr:extracellular solute-binding protein [Paenibacillus sepulcri]
MKMIKKMKSKRSFIVLASLVLALAVSAAGCSSGKTANTAGTPDGDQAAGGTQANEEAPFPISVMMRSFNNDMITSQSTIWKQTEEYTNTKLSISFTPDAGYLDKMNITLASGSMPMVMFAPNVKISSIANAIKSGAFWEVGPYLKDYPNLSQMNPTILNNISTEGKVYGLYTSRALGRLGVSYRKDWLDNVGLTEPKTIDDFYNMLKAFTNNDPDKDGKNDTYGMVVTKYAGPWDMMQTWFGVPNQWGVGGDGKLVKAEFTPEYMEALKFFKKLYDEKLVNPDFAVYDSAKWNDPIINDQAGVAVDVADRSYQIEEAMKTAKPDTTASIDLFGAVSGPTGLHNLPTTGYGGVFLISKSSVKTEADLKKVLSFFDKIEDKDMQILISYGIEGKHYKVEDGKMIPILLNTDPQPANINIKSFNQLLIGVPDVLTTAFKPATPLRGKVQEVQEANLDIV